jgi:DNA-binding XRE family transcriptional regulator
MLQPWPLIKKGVYKMMKTISTTTPSIAKDGRYNIASDAIAIGNFLAEKRMGLRYTQDELGKIIGVSGKTISKWETGNSTPKALMVTRLCAALKISVNEIYLAGNKDYLDILRRRRQQETDKRLQEVQTRLFSREYIFLLVMTAAIMLFILIGFAARIFARHPAFSPDVENKTAELILYLLYACRYLCLFVGIEVCAIIQLNLYLQKARNKGTGRLYRWMLYLIPITFTIFQIVGLIMLVPSCIYLIKKISARSKQKASIEDAIDLLL